VNEEIIMSRVYTNGYFAWVYERAYSHNVGSYILECGGTGRPIMMLNYDHQRNPLLYPDIMVEKSDSLTHVNEMGILSLLHDRLERVGLMVHVETSFSTAEINSLLDLNFDVYLSFGCAIVSDRIILDSSLRRLGTWSEPLNDFENQLIETDSWMGCLEDKSVISNPMRMLEKAMSKGKRFVLSLVNDRLKVSDADHNVVFICPVSQVVTEAFEYPIGACTDVNDETFDYKAMAIQDAMETTFTYDGLG